MEVHVITLGPHLAQDYRFCEGKVNYHLLKGGRYVGQILGLYQFDRQRLIEELHSTLPDVVEAFGTEGPYAYAAATSGFPSVLYMQGIITEILYQIKLSLLNLQWLHHFITQFFERWTVRHGRYFIAENKFTYDFVHRLNAQAKIFLLPNLINPVFFHTKTNSRMYRNKLLFVGNLSLVKGGDELLEVFSRIHRQRPEVQLTIVGRVSPDVRGIIEALPSEVRKSVHLMGVQTSAAIHQIMQTMTILVHPSRMDSSPNVVYEAMATGLPVIATRVGGLPYMIADGETGILVEPRDPDMLAERIIYLLDHPHECQRLGTNASKVIHDRLEPRRIVDELISVYTQVIHQT